MSPGFPWSGALLVIFSAAGFGTLAIFGRFAYAAGMDAPTILFLRFSLAALVMLVWLRLRGETLPGRPAIFWLIGMGALGYVGQSMAYLTALRYASAGLVALLLSLRPSWRFWRRSFCASRSAGARGWPCSWRCWVLP
jgi:drug/metabolite transporter (DMT)-like permease